MLEIRKVWTKMYCYYILTCVKNFCMPLFRDSACGNEVLVSGKGSV